MKQDAIRLVSKCERCQKHSSLIHQPAEPLTTMLSPAPLEWGIDIVGPFPLAAGQRKFLLVAVDYFTKWVEAEPLARITEGEVMKFIWKNIICRFGIPREIISDNGRQFQGQKIQEWCKACASSKDSPQWLILRPMGKLRSQIASWTTPRGSTGETPFSLVYGTEAIIPAELGMPSHRVMNFSEECNENLLRKKSGSYRRIKGKSLSTHTKIQEYHDQFLQQKSKITKFSSRRFGATKGRRPEANRQARSYLGRTIQGHKRNRQRGLRAGRPRGSPLA
ncbi:UNVERIFIED_CONTAM: hypothetical protein Slati_0443700 [Sesamum latifolium]|uniref:Integrase catalytic domain-containing protein n=1 Tax=Sesamum latifolium TaxID=2727402 RepID=A0AAW2XWZ5_9LAMI